MGSRWRVLDAAKTGRVSDSAARRKVHIVIGDDANSGSSVQPKGAWSRSRFALSVVRSFVELGLYKYRTVEQIHRRQSRKLRKLANYVYQYVPHYRSEWQRGGLHPRDLRTVDDLQILPVLERRTITTNSECLTSSKAIAGGEGPLCTMVTSGSTGTPLRIVFSLREVAHSRALAHYGHVRSGRRLGDVMAHVCVPERLVQRRHMLEPLGIGRTVGVDLTEGVERNLTTLRLVQPQVIYGYPSYLSLLAHCVLESDDGRLRPRLIISNGEMLTPAIRSLLSEAFQCEVRDSYGSVEFHQIAFGCRAGALHVIPSVIVEVDNETRGEDGCADILVTSLYLRTMALIRYRLGDRIKLGSGPCECGDNLPTIEKVVGRADDLITLPSRRKVSARAISLLEGVNGILEYQIIQRTPDMFEVLVKPTAEFDEDAAQEIVSIIRRGCGGEPIRVEVRRADSIARSRTGKLQAVVSEVP